MRKHRDVLLAVVSLCAAVVSGCKAFGEAEDSAYDPYQRVGASARAILSGERFRTMTVEIQAVQGHAPSPNALAVLKVFLQTHVNKPGGVRILQDPPLAPMGQDTYSPNDARMIERRYRKRFSENDDLVAYLLFLDGKSADDGGGGFNTLGQAYWNTSIAVFSPTIRRLGMQFSRSSGAFGAVESVVMLHEFGHLMGLVGNGSPQLWTHKDPDHGAHCDNPQCLMHYSVETAALARSYYDGEPPELDEACLEDLRDNGGR